ncbi:MAG: prepilin peptidase [Pirellulales bacterium]|nr:prepilin peptidase [Pirellulales bacterium]
MLDLATALWLGFIGSCIGSFLNVVAYRMPRGMSVVWKPSHCPRCGHDIRVRDNIPVLGWLLLRGKCRDCGQSISPRYALVEAAMGVAFLLLAYVELFTGGANLPGPLTHASGAWQTVWNPHGPLLRLYAFHGALLSVLMAMALVDQDRQRIPWKIVALAFAVAILYTALWPYCYPERTRNIRLKDWKAPVDALLGAAWGASPWIVVGAASGRGGRRDAWARVRNCLLAGGIVGAYLGLRPSVRIAVAWLIAAALTAAIGARVRRRWSPLLTLWLLTLLHLLCWRAIAKPFSW